MSDNITKTVVSQIRYKNADGTLETAIPFGVSFENVIDNSGENPTHYTLSQFFKNYQEMQSGAQWVRKSDTKPTNSNVVFWIDTSANA